MVASCIKNCPMNKNHILFRFPIGDEEIMAIWKRNLDLPKDFVPKSDDRVCSLHFSPIYIGKRRLKKGSVPKKCVEDNTDEVPSSSSKLFKPCVVRNCVNNGVRTVRTHAFPKDATMRGLWKAKCGVQNEEDKNLFICDNHFIDFDIGKKKLIKSAVPTEQLPSDRVINNEHVQPQQEPGKISPATSTASILAEQIPQRQHHLAVQAQHEPGTISPTTSTPTILPEQIPQQQQQHQSAVQLQRQPGTVISSAQLPIITGNDSIDAYLINVGFSLRDMSVVQRVKAKKLINDILYKGQMNEL